MGLLQASFWTSEVPKGFYGIPRSDANYFWVKKNPLKWVSQIVKRLSV